MNEKEIAELENYYGTPGVITLEQEINCAEMNMLKSSQKWGRAHDFTFFIINHENRIAVIRKHRQPTGFYRAPSGGVDPKENLLLGIHREIYEELGIKALITDYLLRAQVLFKTQEDVVSWSTHVLICLPKTNELKPKDIKEIKEAKWVSWGELQGTIRNNLINSPFGLFHYRVKLTDQIEKAIKAKKQLTVKIKKFN